MLFGLDDGREVKSLRFLLSEMDMKTLQVEGKYLLVTEFEVRTVSYEPSFFPFDLWPKRGP